MAIIHEFEIIDLGKYFECEVLIPPFSTLLGWDAIYTEGFERIDICEVDGSIYQTFKDINKFQDFVSLPQRFWIRIYATLVASKSLRVVIEPFVSIIDYLLNYILPVRLSQLYKVGVMQVIDGTHSTAVELEADREKVFGITQEGIRIQPVQRSQSGDRWFWGLGLLPGTAINVITNVHVSAIYTEKMYQIESVPCILISSNKYTDIRVAALKQTVRDFVDSESSVGNLPISINVYADQETVAQQIANQIINQLTANAKLDLPRLNDTVYIHTHGGITKGNEVNFDANEQYANPSGGLPFFTIQAEIKNVSF